MRVFIAGATGVLGRRLVERCVDRGHEVVGLTRDDEGDETVRTRGGIPYRGDVLDADSLQEGVDGADVVVHAATKIPTDPKPSDADWEQNDRVRREGTQNLADAAGRAGVDRFVLQSIVWVARRPDGEAFDETAPPNPDRSTRSAADAERILATAAEEHGFDPVVLRGGWFYGPESAHTIQSGQGLLARRLPILGRGVLGRGDALLSFVHVDDAAGAFAAAVDGDATGTFHVVDDEPVTYASFLRTFAENLGAPEPWRVPAWLARPVLGESLRRLLTTPMPTDNERIRDAFDWSPTYESVESGLAAVVDEWATTDTGPEPRRADR